MTDKKDSAQANSEYQPKGEEGMADVASGGYASSTQKPLFKRLLVPIAVVGSVLVVYTFLNWSSSRHTKNEGENFKIESLKNATMTPPTPVVAVTPAQPVAMPPPMPPVDNALNEKILQAQDEMQGKLDNISAKNEEYRSQVANLNIKLAQSEGEIATINKNLSGISDLLASVTADVKKLTAPKPKKIKKKIKAPIAYHVNAIVPGRAWLLSSDGQLVTVRAGDKLAGYGRILAISAPEGKVLTSTGAVIQYGVNDI